MYITILFLDNDKDGFSNVLSLLQIFELSSRLKIDWSKSGLAVVNMDLKPSLPLLRWQVVKSWSYLLFIWVFHWVVILDISLFWMRWWRRSLSVLILGKGLIFL